jgi:predicted transport protein
MAKVTIDNPTDKILSKQKANLADHVTDDTGRIIKLRIPDALDEFDITSALGKDSENLGCLGMAGQLIYVESIDGEAFPIPQSYEQVRAAIKRLGRSGFKAVMQAVQDYQKAEAASMEESIASIKK